MEIGLPTFQSFKQSRWFKRSLWAAAVFLVYVLVGFFVLPPIIKAQLLKRLPPITKRQAAVREVKFNPLVLSLTIRGLSLTEPDGQVFASWEELYVNFQLSSIFRLAWTFAEIGLKQPYGHVALFKDGQFNFANMFEETAPPPPKPAKPASLPRINVWRLHIDDGAVALDDATHRLPLHTDFKPINISLTNLTTRLGKGSVYSFQASSDSGRSFSWAGSLMVQPFQSEGHFELVGGELSKWTPVVRDFLRAEIIDGRVDVRADYTLSVGTNGVDATVTNGVVELSDLKVKDLKAGDTFTTLPSLSVVPLDFDLRQRNLHVAQVKIAGFTELVRVEKDHTLNLNNLLDLPPAKPGPTNALPATPAAPWTLTVDDFLLDNAAISFADLSRSSRFETLLKPVQFHLQRFTTRPDSDAAYDFSVATESGEKVSGRGTLSIAPLRSSGEVRLADFEIRKYAPYYQDNLRGEVLAGKIGAGADYRFAGSTNAPLVTVSNAGVALTGLQLKAADTGETVVSIPSFSVEGTEASLADRKARVGLVKSSGGSFLVRQMKDGKINLLGLANSPPAKPVDTNAPTPAELPWTVLVKEIAFDGYTIKVEDQKPAKPAFLTLDQLAFNVKGVSTVSNEPITASLSVRLNEGGTATVQGTAKISPPLADLQVAVSDLDLRPFQPYLNEQARIAITSGRFNTRGRARYTPPGSGTPLVQFAGELSLTNLATTDQVLFKDLVKWEGLQVSGIDFDLQPNQLQVQEVKLRGLQTSVIIGPDQRLNLKTILPEQATNAPSPAAATAAAGPAAAVPAATASSPGTNAFPMQMNALLLENVALHFIDESIEPHCTFDVQELSGAVRGLSSDQASTATVDLQGKVDAASPFAISGKVNPLAKELRIDLGVAFTNTDLTAFSTYLEKYAGHPLNKGKLFMGLHYDINQKQLKAENKFRIDYFTLGPRNNSTNATHLPVKLAVALLKDRNGRINLDVPLTGRTDDPQFSIAPLVWKVIVNLIEKAATSPFSLLGALVGGGEELSFVEFVPGQAEIPEGEAQKLQKLVKALYERPGVNLEITGSFDPDKDRAALARGKLEQYLKVLRLKELASTTNVSPTLDTLQVEPTERERLLRRVFADLGTNQTLVLPVDAMAPDTNAPAVLPVKPAPVPTIQAPATNAPARTAQAHPPTAGRKGAKDLMQALVKPPPAPKPAAPAAPQAPATPEGTPLSPEEIEAKLVAAIQLSADDQRNLIKQRALAVQSFILHTGSVTPERLFIVTPKAAATSAKGQARVDLSLE
jgi:hypothetical protein